jgi:radical SAM protein with 4Fe4S-binding SPASM domain
MKDFFPVQIFLGLTYRCNLNCAHCYVEKKNDNTDPSTEEITKMINRLADLGVFKIIFTHGENLLRKDLFQIIEHCNNLDIHTTLITNGILLNSEKAKRLKKIVSKIVISLDGLDKNFHNNLRNKEEAWNKAVEAMEVCKLQNIPFSINTTINKSSRTHLEQIINFAQEKKASDIYFLSIRSTHDDPREQSVNPEDYHKIWQLKHKYKSKINIAMHDPLAIYYLTPKNFRNKEEIASFNECQAGKAWLSILPSGQVQPCNFWPLSLGDAYKEDIKKIWEEWLYTKKRYENTPKECQNCIVAETCGGGCKALFELTKSRIKRDKRCLIN